MWNDLDTNAAGRLLWEGIPEAPADVCQQLQLLLADTLNLGALVSRHALHQTKHSQSNAPRHHCMQMDAQDALAILKIYRLYDSRGS